MPNTNKLQTFGTQAPVKPNPPVASPSSTNPTKATFQTIGDRVPLSHTTSQQSPSSVASKGTMQVIGDRSPLGSMPVKAIGNSSTLPFSDRSHQQSDVKTVKP